MHIILVSDRLTTTKTVVLTGRHMLLAVAALATMIIGLSSLFSYVTVRHAAEIRLPFLQDLLQAAIWLCAFGGNRIEWRGRRFRLRRDGTLQET